MLSHLLVVCALSLGCRIAYGDQKTAHRAPAVPAVKFVVDEKTTTS